MNHIVFVQNRIFESDPAVMISLLLFEMMQVIIS